MMRTVCEKDLCTGCMACAGVCKEHAIAITDGLRAYNAVIDESLCTDCGACKRICPNVTPVQKRRPIEWRQGWAECEIRGRSSSGGAASAMIRAFIEHGGYVAACLFEQGEFVFRLTNSAEETKRFAGSKYVKSNPKKIYGEIDEKLKAGERVLFIGLPCQVAALKNRIRREEKLYTIDLICHGTPSPRLLSMFLREKGVDIETLEEVKFREKTSFGLWIGAKKLMPAGLRDMYTHAFLAGLDYTEGCYACRYAELNRVSDVTLGDSWGSELEKDEQAKGISLILCQTEKGKELVSQSGILTKAVDIEKAVRANGQLNHPTARHEKRDTFFKHINRGFHAAMRKCNPKFYYKKKLKAILVALRLMEGNEN